MNRIHDEILEKALRDPNPKPHHPYLLFLLALLLLGLTLTYLTPELLDYLQGRAATHEIGPDYTLYLKNGKRVVLDSAVYEQLKTLYQTTQTHEFKVCLLGEKREDLYSVEGLYFPQTYSESVYHVTAAPCPPETLIALHSHPPEKCIVSDQDLQSQTYYKQVNPDALGAVLCGEKRFGFYG